jgi:hypothetical protein
LASDPIVLQFAQREALDLRNFNQDNWNPNLKLLRKAYQIGQSVESIPISGRLTWEKTEAMSLDLAIDITDNANAYPGSLVSLAEDRCRQDVAAHVVPVADIATKDRWFELI